MSNRRNRNPRLASSIVPENLEGRTLFSAYAATALVGGVLTVTGTPQADDVYITYQASTQKYNVLQRLPHVSAYTQTASYSVSAVKSIKATMGDGDDNFVFGDNSRPVPCTIDGGNGADHLTGGGGNDTIRAGAGNDYVDAGYGNDLIDGGTGRDTLFGNKGIDTVDYSARTENLTIKLDGTFSSGAAGEGDFIYTDVENINGGKGNDTITGSSLANVIDGGAGNDTIHGGAGDDTLTGGLGKDKLFGDDGNDIIYARNSPADADTVDGGLGTDKVQKDASDIVTKVEVVLA